MIKNKKPIVYAFIDSQNLNLSVRELGWRLDFARFRVYLRDKYQVKTAYLFIGYMPQNADLYAHLQEAGFICIFRPTLTYKDGTTKGNCDAELVLQAMIEFDNYDKAIIVSGDGDFQCLAKYLYELGKLGALFIPNQQKYSALLKFNIFKPYLRFVSDLRKKLEYSQKRRTPARTRP
ncbi:MAG: NYN domain-containing protein [Segetibacter sp.]